MAKFGITLKITNANINAMTPFQRRQIGRLLGGILAVCGRTAQCEDDMPRLEPDRATMVLDLRRIRIEKGKR
jgi:hypothetical protein